MLPGKFKALKPGMLKAVDGHHEEQDFRQGNLRGMHLHNSQACMQRM